MCGVMLAIIIFVLGPFKFSITLNSFMCFPSYTNFIFGTVSYCSSSSSCYLAAASSCCWSLTSSSFAAAGFYCCSFACSSPVSFSTISFNLSRLYPTFSIILLYNKEAISRMLYSLSESAFRVAAKGADTALYNFEIVFLKNEFILYWYIFEKFFGNFMDRKRPSDIFTRPHQHITSTIFLSLFSRLVTCRDKTPRGLGLSRLLRCTSVVS